MASKRNLRPTEGARFILERPTTSVLAVTPARDAVDAATDEIADLDAKPAATIATYHAAIYTPDAEFATTITLGEDGTVALAAASGAPAELDERLKNIAKLVARDAPKRRDDGLAVWPSRIMRWRK